MYILAKQSSYIINVPSLRSLQWDKLIDSDVDVDKVLDTVYKYET